MTKSKWTIIKDFLKVNLILTIFTFITGICYNLFTILIPISIGKFYEFSFGFSSHRLMAFKFIPFINTKNFNAFLGLFLILIVLRFLSELANRYSISLLGERFSKTLREELFKNQLQISNDVYEHKGIGKYLLRYSGDLKSIQNYLKSGLIRFSQDIFLCIAAILVIGMMDIYLSLIITFSILISSIALWFINKVIYKISLDRRNYRSGMLSFVNTRLRGMLTLKAFNKYNPEEKRFNKRSKHLYDLGKKYAFTTSLLQAFIPAITYIMLGVVMLYVYIASQNPTYQLQGSSLLVMILLIISFLPVLRRSLRVSIIWKLGNISFTKLIAIFNLNKEDQLDFIPVSFSGKTIQFNDVTYKYSNSSDAAIKNLTLNISPNSILLLKGEPGSGKSTFTKLLLKLSNPTNGYISIDNHKYLKMSKKSIRKNIAVVSKDYPLYGKDVYEAVAYNRKEKTKLRAESILLKLQQFEPEHLKLSLEDKIGDLGNNLTSGQQKILMYCRALLTRKPIIVIEEPLKDLNHKTQEVIIKLCNTFKKEKTVILLNDVNINGFAIDQLIEL